MLTYNEKRAMMMQWDSMLSMVMTNYRDLLWKARNNNATMDELYRAFEFYRTCLDDGDLDVINDDWGEEDGPLTEKQVEGIIEELENKIEDAQHWDDIHTR